MSFVGRVWGDACCCGRAVRRVAVGRADGFDPVTPRAPSSQDQPRSAAGTLREVPGESSADYIRNLHTPARPLLNFALIFATNVKAAQLSVHFLAPEVP